MKIGVTFCPKFRLKMKKRAEVHFKNISSAGESSLSESD